MYVVWKDEMSVDGEVKGVGDGDEFCGGWGERESEKFGEKMGNGRWGGGRGRRYERVDFIEDNKIVKKELVCGIEEKKSVC